MPDPHSPYLGRGDENYEAPGADALDLAFLRAIEMAGFEPRPVWVHPGNLGATVAALDCDVVFNLCDGFGAAYDGIPGLEVIDALERRGLPYTGARAPAYRIGCDKAEMIARFEAAGVPTPLSQVVRSPHDPLAPALLERFPLIVKPRIAGGGAGIRLDSVVEDRAHLAGRIAAVTSVYGDAVVSEFIDGRELTVGILGEGERLELFPAVEVRFGAIFPTGRGLRTFDSKWDVDSPLYGAFDLLCPAPLRPALEARTLQVAAEAYRAIEGSGYGRVDLRLGEGGLYVLEVNPNCSLEWNEQCLADCAMFPIGARACGYEFPALLAALLEDALARAAAVPVRRRTRRRR